MSTRYGSGKRCRRPTAWLLLAAIGVSPAFANRVEIRIEGLDAQMAQAMLDGLTLGRYAGRDVSKAQLQRLVAECEPEARAVLETFGYYDATLAPRIEPGPEVDRVVLTVTPGSPVLVDALDVDILGDARQIPPVRAALDAFVPRVGEPLDHVLYESSKAAVASALVSAGYLSAQLRTHRVRVSGEARAARIELLWESGERARFGEVQFSGAQFPAAFLQRFIPWSAGDFYSGEQALELQQRLIDADYFALVTVDPDGSRHATGSIPVGVSLAPAKRSVYSGSLQGSTDTGPGVRIELDRRWVNPAGHKFHIDGDYAEKFKALSAGYRIPLPGRDDRNVDLAVTHRSARTDTSESRSTRVAASETRQWHGFARTLALQFLTGDFEIASERGNSTLLYFEGALSRTEEDDPVFALHGYSFDIAARFAPRSAIADTSFAQIGLRAKRVHAFTRRSRLIGRATLAAMAVDEFDELPPELRFFAGGDRSIRGFDYQSIGGINEQGEVIGGQFLAVASVEVEHYFSQRWGIALFADAGDAFRNTRFDANVGAGAGLRWRSPVGPVRVDIGVPLRSDYGAGARLHVVIGPDL